MLPPSPLDAFRRGIGQVLRTGLSPAFEGAATSSSAAAAAVRQKCRAGALTVSEVAAAGVAALFIPFPHAVDDHQTRNAEFLVENDAALLLQESQTDARKLANVLSSLAGDRAGLANMAMRGRAVAVPDSTDRVAGLCREYLASGVCAAHTCSPCDASAGCISSASAARA